MVLVTITVFSTNAQGIQFESSTFDAAIDKASKEKKMLFMDCYTPWCGPCKRLAQKVFPNDTVGAFFNKHFVNLKMDMTKEEGTTLGKVYQVSAYPTMLFINPANKQVVYKLMGAHMDIHWLINEAKKALDPTLNLAGLEAAYLQNKKDAKVVNAYLAGLQGADMLAKRDQILKEYLNQLKGKDQYSRETWDILAPNTSNPYGFAFKYILGHANGFDRSVGRETVDGKMEVIYKYAILPLIRRKRLPDNQFPSDQLEALKVMLPFYIGKDADYFRAQLEMIDKVQQGDYRGMMDALDEAAKQGVLKDESRHFYFVWLNLTYLKECKDESAINRGLKWLDKIKDEPVTRPWLKMKASLYEAKGNTKKAAKYRTEAENLKR